MLARTAPARGSAADRGGGGKELAPVQRVIGVLRRRRHEQDLAGELVAMAEAAQRSRALGGQLRGDGSAASTGERRSGRHGGKAEDQ